MGEWREEEWRWRIDIETQEGDYETEDQMRMCFEILVEILPKPVEEDRPK